MRNNGIRSLAQFARAGLAGGIFFMASAGVYAHEVSSVSLISYLDTVEGTYLLDAAMEVVPSADDFVNDEIPPEAAARQFAEEYLAVLFDEAKQAPNLEISLESSSDERTPAELQRQQVLARMSGDIPKGAKEFLLYLDPACPMAVVMVVVKDEHPSRRMQVILSGEYSRPVNVEPVLEGDPFAAGETPKTTGSADDPAEEPAKGESEDLRKPGKVASSGSDPTSRDDGAFGAMLAAWIGFYRVSWFPVALTGAVFLLSLRRAAAFSQIAALLIGLSLALSLASWDIVRMPVWGTAFLGVLLVGISLEPLFHVECRWWRVGIVGLAGYGTGLLVAGAPSVQFRLAGSEDVEVSRVVALAAGAQLALIASALIALALLLSLSRFSWYRKAVVQTLCILLAAGGGYLVVERFL